MKKYSVNRSKGYPILGGGLPKIDTTTEYFIVGYAKAFGNRPIISRCDGASFEGETKWIVDHHNLKEIK
ncbi:hypothetical protein ACT17G_18510 [Bacillus velezensis]|uniref:hypothetical protein n=1 Tax=Bacillus TaxID=1386 RepID=UPI00073A7B02|nr:MULTISPECIES: hypothetical protein [Bacillus]ALV03220.1 hypothetical protein AVM03_12855 [Bacillus amyloliquefaciens]UFH22560.1 hypothetical protein LOK79_18435 [Bacillus velezensis]UUT17184.1 hypothetical protein NRF13_19045 [Bacillus velezensis]BET19654.1 hypothetical protein RBIBE_36440 [Bacillus velezensis]